MRTQAKVLKFPLSGVARDLDYRKAYIPAEETTFATPFAVNVRGTDTFGNRNRGGSRPGLKPVESATPVHAHPTIEGIDDPDIEPTASCTYRARACFASGSAWYMSAIGNAQDWAFAGDAEDPSRAFSGNVALAGMPGETITALMPIRDKALVIATRHGLWILNGDPVGGAISCVSEHVGCVSADAWDFDGSRVWFVAENGLYAFALGETPIKVSGKIPDSLVGLDEAVVAYDSEEEAVHVLGSANWYYDIANKAFWPMYFGEPIDDVGRVCEDGIERIAVMTDSGWRTFDAETPCEERSLVAIGPIRTGLRDDMDGMVGELTATIADGSDDVRIEIYTAHSPEGAVRAAENVHNPHQTLSAKAGWNNTCRPRMRGNWAVFVVSCDGRWGFESMTAVMKTLGRLR